MMSTAPFALQDAVSEFMSLGGQTTHRFNPGQASLYTGLQFEELAEKVTHLSEAQLAEEPAVFTEIGTVTLARLAKLLTCFSELFKSGRYADIFAAADRTKLVDDDVDLAWVSLGAVFSTVRDGHGSIQAVSDANHAKFHDGIAIRDANGKIKKPEGWTEPDHRPFL